MDCNAQVLEGAVGGGGSNGGEKGKEKEQRNVEEELSTGVGAEPPFHVENPERRLVMHGGGEGELSGDEEEEFVFDDDGEEETGKNRWMAVARFYSGRIVKAKVMFEELSNVWGEVKPRPLGDNRFLIEFASEWSLNFALHGGPWKFKGVALIVVNYDGFSRLSEIVIDSIPLWIRIYDMPVAMMKKESFVSALGAKVGRVMEIGEEVKDFKRVRVDFALADALKPSVRIKVKDRGFMEFEVKYEDVPYFCFCCGRIGHSERECPEEDLSLESARFGVGLRASPFKRAMGRQLAFYTASPAAQKVLNFSGHQKEKVAFFTGSTTSRGGQDGRSRSGRSMHVGGEGSGGVSSQSGGNSSKSQSRLSKEQESELAGGVQNMVVDDTTGKS